ncbi:MAG TPA: serine/threonine-protein kinase [Rhodanobacteraceae bacterium]|nr:serine/threonine-protein kinase [Rhodanobacteraceae bacterium]
MDESVPVPGSIGELRRLFDLVCDLAPASRRARLVEAGAADSVIAEIEELLAVDGATGARVRAPVAQLLQSLPETELGAGDSLGPWRLVRRLGRGGMGAVFLVERADGHFQQQAAIKLVRGLPGAETFAQFTSERQILAALKHPHIAGLLDGGATPGGQPYLVMEYIAGVPIDVYCSERRIDLAGRLALFRDVCNAVQFAHRHLIVHCDLKPSNVLVREDGSPVLLDFGIARVLDRMNAPTPVSDPLTPHYFTPGYASPEQRRGEAVTTASDIYALGLILFELVTGRKAQIDDKDRTIARLAEASVQPSGLAASVPWRTRIEGDLDAIVLHATAAEPAGRYTSAEALAEDVARFLAHRPISARPQTLLYRGSRLLRRRWPVFAVAALGCVLAVLFTWRLVIERDNARSAQREAQVQAATAERVSGFIVSVFDGANPDSNGGHREVSARDLLDTAAARIDHELANQPRVRARMLDTLGTAYRYIGRPESAIDLLERAADLYADPKVGQPLDAAAALSQVAVLYVNNAYPAAKAENAARRALALRRPLVAEDSEETADSLNTLGIVLDSQGRFDEAEHDLQRALAIRKLRNGPDSPDVAAVLHNLGLLLIHRGAPKEAIPYLEQALAIKRKRAGEHSTEFEITLRLLARAVSASGDRARGLDLYRQHLALCNTLYGEDSAQLSGAYNEFGSALQDAGDYLQAAEHYRHALSIDARATGKESANYAVVLNNLATVHEDMGDYAGAEPLFRESLALRRKLYPADSLNVARVEHNLARLLIEQGRLDEAGPLLEKAVALRLARLGADHRDTAKSQLWTAEYLRRRGDFDGARATLDALSHSAASFTPLMQARRDVIEAALAEQAHDDAGALRKRRAAWDVMRRSVGGEHPATAGFAFGYARALAAAGHMDEAHAIIAPLRGIIDADFAPDAPIRQQLAVWH